LSGITPSEAAQGELQGALLCRWMIEFKRQAKKEKLNGVFNKDLVKQ